MTPSPTFHFLERLDERHCKCNLDFTKVEVVTTFSSNRYEHPKVMKYLKKHPDCKYLVSREHNIVVPVSIRSNRMITALYYK
jgi:hypothetical protein